MEGFLPILIKVDGGMPTNSYEIDGGISIVPLCEIAACPLILNKTNERMPTHSHSN